MITTDFNHGIVFSWLATISLPTLELQQNVFYGLNYEGNIIAEMCP